MDSIGGIAIIVLIWIIGAVFEQKKKQERRRRSQKAKPPPLEIESVSADPVRPLPDASQREGSKLEQMLRQLNPELADLADQARAQSRQKAPVKVKPAERRAPPANRPAAPEPVVLEDDFRAKADRAIARRRRAAEDHSRNRTAADHVAFHEAASHQAVPGQEVRPEVEPPAGTPSIEQAIVWREILGPPRALTIDEV